MKTEGPALFFAPWRFPPTPERLIALVARFSAFGYRTVIVDWGGLFPWSEKRFQEQGVYPELAVVEAHRRASGNGLNLLPRLPFGSGMGNFLKSPGYGSLRLGGTDPEAIDPAAPGAAKFACDLLEDIRLLLPGLSGVYIDPVPGGAADPECLQCLAHRVLPRLLESASGLRLFAGKDVAGLPEMAGTCACMETDRFIPSGNSGLPPTIEIYFDLMPGAAEGTKSEDGELRRSAGLREELGCFAQLLERSWTLIRAASEESFLPPALANSAQKSAAALRRALAELDVLLQRLAVAARGFEAVLGPMVAPGVSAGWSGSRIRALEEERERLEAKLRLVETWVERR